MKDWYDIYKERMNERYANKIRTKYAPFITEILATGSCKYIEIGCGAGNITKAIREKDRNLSMHTLIDNCPKMLGLAIENNPESKVQFYERVVSLKPFVKESLLFGLKYNWISYAREGKIQSSMSELDIRTIIRKMENEARQIINRALFVGKWFADAGQAQTVMSLWGVRP